MDRATAWPCLEQRCQEAQAAPRLPPPPAPRPPLSKPGPQRKCPLLIRPAQAGAQRRQLLLHHQTTPEGRRGQEAREGLMEILTERFSCGPALSEWREGAGCGLPLPPHCRPRTWGGGRWGGD